MAVSDQPGSRGTGSYLTGQARVRVIRRYNTIEDPSDVRSGTPEHVVFLDGMDMHQERVVLNRPVGPLVNLLAPGGGCFAA